MNKHFVKLAWLLLFAILMPAQDVPKAEVYAGYSFLRFNSSSPANAFTANGGLGSVQFNFNRFIGVVAEFGGIHNGSMTIGGSPTLHPDQTAFTYLFGPRFTFNKAGVVSPFFEVLGGGIHNSRSFFLPNSSLPTPLPPISGVTVTPGLTATKFASTQNAAALAIGGGIDIRLSRRISVRPVQVDYMPTNFSPFNIAGLGRINNANWQQNLRYSGGIGFRFGMGAPPSPPTASCSATPAELLPWEGPVNASVQTADFKPKHSLDYAWSSTSGAIPGQGSSATIDTAKLAPGKYIITSNVKDPKAKKLNSATCTASFTVKQPQNPTVACSASPGTVHPGDPVTINVQTSSPDGSRIEQPKLSTSAGSLKEGGTTAGGEPGQSTTVATLDTSNAPPGPVNVNVGVSDVHGLSATCTASANVVAPPPPPPPQVVSETLVTECDFKSAKTLARVDNECKAALDQVALRMQQEPNGRLVIVGYADDQNESLVTDVEALRAANAKNYLTGGEAKQQIDASRIETRKSSARDSGNVAKFYFVPEGGSFTVQETTIVDENSLPANRTGVPKKH